MAKSDREKTQHEILKHVKKPDVDNLMKLYMDVLTGIVYDDDNCVSIGSAVKVYSAMPRVVIYIEETGSTVTQNEVWEGTWPTQNNGEF